MLRQPGEGSAQKKNCKSTFPAFCQMDIDDIEQKNEQKEEKFEEQFFLHLKLGFDIPHSLHWIGRVIKGMGKTEKE